MRTNRKEGRRTAPYTAILLMSIVSVAVGLSRSANAQTAQFSTEADAVSGTVTKSILGLIDETVTIAPVDQSSTVTSGDNNVHAASDSQTVLGVEVYNLGTVDDSTSASYTATLDGGLGTASTAAGSLLGGLVTWQSNIDPLNCTIDPTVAGQIDCSSIQTTYGLTINGVAVAPGTYPSGASFAVTGTLADAECGLGVETFSGSLITQEPQITGDGTDDVTLKIVGLHLLGEATCRTLGLIPLFSTSYDIALAGPSANAVNDGTGGQSNIVLSSVTIFQ